MIQTQVSLTEVQADRLRRLARERRTSMAALIRDAVESTYPESDGPSRDELWMRARSVIGIGDSGLGDLAERHDDYLAELD